MGQDGRVALVTGGGRGIGKAIALGLAEDGADIAINYRKNDEAAAETVAEIEKIGGEGSTCVNSMLCEPCRLNISRSKRASPRLSSTRSNRVIDFLLIRFASPEVFH